MFKGNVFVARREYIKQYCTPEQSQTILNLLSEAARTLLTQEILTVKWYESKLELEINQALVTVMGNKKIEFLQTVGAFGADHNMKGIYKLIFLVTKPETLVKKTPLIFKQLHSNGIYTVESHSKNSGIMKIIEWDDISLEHIHILIGWSCRALELVGAKNVHTKILEINLSGKKVTLQSTWD